MMSTMSYPKPVQYEVQIQIANNQISSTSSDTRSDYAITAVKRTPALRTLLLQVASLQPRIYHLSSLERVVRTLRCGIGDNERSKSSHLANSFAAFLVLPYTMEAFVLASKESVLSLRAY